MFILVLVLLSACDIEQVDKVDLGEKDYSLEQLQLGLAFVPDSNEGYRTNTLEHLTKLGIKDIRLGQDWSLRQPELDVYNFEPLRQRLDFYSDNGIDVLMTLDIKNFPTWTEQLTDEEMLEYFDIYTGLLLEEFGEQIAYIQVGNEWDWEIDTYLDGKEALYISMHEILYKNVNDLEEDFQPKVAIGSISIGGLMSIAYDQSLIRNVFYQRGPLFSEEELIQMEDEILSKADRIRCILGAVQFEVADLHLYDDYWNWSLYLQAYEGLLPEQTRPITYIASEFGGPHPEMEVHEDRYRALQLYHYVKTLDGLGFDKAYYYKLHESVNEAWVVHKYSYLITRDGKLTTTYKVLGDFLRTD